MSTRGKYDPQMCAKCELYKEHGSKYGQCTGCQITKYCSKKCQKQQWTKHKSVCLQVGHLIKLDESLDDELYMKIPDRHKPLPKLEDMTFLISLQASTLMKQNYVLLISVSVQI